MASKMIRRGHIYFASLDPVRGREQAGIRPVLVVSSDAINSLPLVVTVVAGTDAANISRDYPVNVRVTAAESGLPHDTVFLCFQVRSLDPSRLATPNAGALPANRMAEVDAALRRALEL
jgi:mRNA interferase MazF